MDRMPGLAPRAVAMARYVHFLGARFHLALWCGLAVRVGGRDFAQGRCDRTSPVFSRPFGMKGEIIPTPTERTTGASIRSG